MLIEKEQIGIKLLVLWIYIDAGSGKYFDPKQGWTYGAKPLPALDTYTRHTLGAQYIYGILGPEGLRMMTPMVVYVELLCAPMAFLGSYFGSTGFVNFAIALICQLHVGIAISIRNSVLLSLVACSVWCVFLPIGWDRVAKLPKRVCRGKSGIGFIISAILVGAMIAGNVWFETIGTDCTTGSLRKVWSTLLQNRWNVFIGAEE